MIYLIYALLAFICILHLSLAIMISWAYLKGDCVWQPFWLKHKEGGK